MELIARNLTIGYDSSAAVATIAEADLRTGSFIALVGRNGSGKSTLLRTMSGLIPPLDGRLELHGDPLSTYPPTALAQLISVVLTEAPDLRHTTVRELVVLGRLPYTTLFGKMGRNDYASADDAIREVGIEHLRDRQFSQLSDGERQKVMIARALAQSTPYLLLDEPSAFLDYPSRCELMQLLSRLAHKKEKAILLSTHDIDQALEYVDSLWVIRDRQLHILDPHTTSIDDIFTI